MVLGISSLTQTPNRSQLVVLQSKWFFHKRIVVHKTCANCAAQSCSVWKIGPDGTTRIHSHTASRSNVLTSRDVYCTSATYFGPASVLVSDSLGRLDVIKQAF
jgi:hypothetical protein